MTKHVMFCAALAFGGALAIAGCDGGTGGSCDPACGASQACCGDTCVFTITDRNNCGGCGTVCAASQICSEGVCVQNTLPDTGPPSDCSPACPMTSRCCGSRCVERSVPPNTDGRSSASFMNCNGCGITCNPEQSLSCSIPGGGPDGVPRCMCGDLDACPPGQVCATVDGLFTCVDLMIDPDNCGALGNACGGEERCVAGECVCGSTGGRCGEGLTCCNEECVDTASDPANCGGCRVPCTPNAPDCAEGSCSCAEAGRSCVAPMPGLFGIGGSPGESCCPGMGCVANTDESCACEACEGEDVCTIGGSGISLPGTPMTSDIPTVCCAEEGGFGSLFGACGSGGFPFPFPGGDGGIPLPFDAAVPGVDAGLPASDGGTDAGPPADAGMDGGSSSDAGMDAGA